MSTFSVTEELDVTEADRSVVAEGLRDFNHRHMPRSDAEPLTLLLCDSTGAISGGLLASTRRHWLLIDVLWVADKYRSRGFGRDLVEKAEIVSSSRGCRLAVLDTTEFQARRFYEGAG
jgi:GNAT superfamily N-acetyltransferase